MLKKIPILLFLSVPLLFSFSQSQNTSSESFYAVVTHVESLDGTRPMIHYQDEAVALNRDDKVGAGATILTSEGQILEMVIYQGIKAYGILLIKENTDFKFNFNDLTTILDVRVIYGGIRGVITEGIVTTINSQTVKSAIYGADFGLVSVINDEGDRRGYAIVFGGELVFASREDVSNSELVRPKHVCEFEDYRIFPPRPYTKEEFYSWKPSMLFRTRNIPSNITLVLEYLEYEEPEIKDSRSKFPQFDYGKFVSSFLSFEAGTLNYDRKIGVKFVWRPGATLMGDKFEFGFYLPFNFAPSRAFTKSPFMHIYGNYNEWSFGSDQARKPAAIVYDLFGDLLSKLRVIRYNTIEDPGFFYAGIYNDVYDFNNFSLINFNSRVFYPKIRRTSLYSGARSDWFRAFVYAEDIMPEGLYGTELVFMTPTKSFKFKMALSAFMETYDLITFYNKESFFPGQFNAALSFDAFNLPSIGFSVYMTGGILVPFSYNFAAKTSLFTDMVNNAPEVLAGNIAANAGFHIRAMDFNINAEFIMDSGVNKVGLFDTYYVATRGVREKLLKNWMIQKTQASISANDFNFGFRIRLMYAFLKYMFVESSYQLTLSPPATSAGSAAAVTATVRYYDKLYLKLTFDSHDRWKINFATYILWQVQVLPLAFSDPRVFQLANVMYTGFKLKLHKGVDVNIAIGVVPELYDAIDPWYSQFMLDLYVTIMPLPFFDIKDKESAVRNL